MEERADKKGTGKSINKNRRMFLTLGITGAAAFVVGKIVGPYLDSFVNPKATINQVDFKNFRLVETRDEMTLSDRNGNDIVVIEKDSFR